MADRSGYIGRNPGDSSVIVARQVFSPTGVQTDFTFASGYTVGYLDAYLNGVRLIEGQDYSATDTSTVGLTSFAQNGDVLELVAYKAFNATNVQSAGGDFSVGANLSVTGTLTVGGVEVQPGAAGTWASYDSNTGISTTKKVKIENNLEVTGAASTFSGNLTVTGTLTGASIGIQSAGTVVGSATTLNFIGVGNTFAVNGNTIDISIAGGGGGGIGEAVGDADGLFSWIGAAATITSNITLDISNAGPNESYIITTQPLITIETGIAVTVGTGKTWVTDVLNLGGL